MLWILNPNRRLWTFMTTDKLVKSLTTKNFRVELLETDTGGYIVAYESKRFGDRQYSETVKDYKLASFLFDLKANELEGN